MSELPTSAFGVLRLFNTSRQGIEMFSGQLISAVENGEVNALELKAFLKTMEAIIEKVDKATREQQLKEAEKYSEKKFGAFGCEVEKAEVGTKYDYLTACDPVYEQRLVIFNSAAEQLKEREAFLKALHNPITIIDEDTGQVATVRPPVKRSTSGLKFSIK